MTDDGTDALEQALALHSAPGRSSMLRRMRLPADVLSLIKIAGGDSDVLANAEVLTGATKQTLIDASKLYLQRVLFGDTDCYRVLGVRPDAPDSLIKLHHRWLIRWLHPDRAAERWEAVYAERVNRAWQTLSSPERRARYDEAMKALRGDVDRHASVRRQKRIERAVSQGGSLAFLSTRAARWISVVVLGGLGMASVAILGLLYWVDRGGSSMRPVEPSKMLADMPVRRSGTPSHRGAMAGMPKPLPGGAGHSTTTVPVVQGAQAPISSLSESSPPAVTAPIRASSPVDDPAGLAVDTAMDRELTAVRRQVELPSVSPVRPTARIPVAPKVDRFGGFAAISTAAGSSHAPMTKSDDSSAHHREDARSDPADALVASVAASPVISRTVSETRWSSGAAPVGVGSATQAPGTTSPVPTQSTTKLVETTNGSQAQTPGGSSDSSAMSPGEGASFVTRAFVAAYNDGDLQGMQSLFTRSAVNDRGGIDRIRDDYSSFFRTSSARELHMKLIWTYGRDRIVGNGSFDARIVSVGDSTSRNIHGWMHIEAVPVDGQWKIESLRHNNPQ